MLILQWAWTLGNMKVYLRMYFWPETLISKKGNENVPQDHLEVKCNYTLRFKN